MLNHSPVTTAPDRIYRGTAAEDIEPNSVILLVICPELIPNAPYGNVGAAITEENISLQTRDGKPIQSKASTANHIVATWEGSSNQRYPSLIRKGEPVEVFQTEGQDKFFWRETGRGRDFRKVDRVYAEAAASDPTKPSATKDDTNTYSAYLDPTAKKVGMKTSKANGEVAAFVMEADLSNGTFVLSDDGGDNANRIFVDTGGASGIPCIQLNLSTGVTLKLENEDLYIKVPGKMILSVNDRFIVDSPLTIFNQNQKGSIILNAAAISFNAARSFVATAKAIGLNASSTKIAGVLAAAKGRITELVKANFGSEYKADTLNDIVESPIREADNSPDTNMTGPPYRNP